MRVVLVPPDVRPPTLALPALLARAAGATVLTPPETALPDLNVPGDTLLLERWLEDACRDAGALVVCLETLCLGGMIPARRIDTPLEDVLPRLATLERLKRARPELRILAHGVVTRVAHDDDPHEEKPYYGEWGRALRSYSEARDRLERHGAREDEERLERARAAVPAEVLGDWLRARERNHALHLRALDALAAGTLEHLCVTLDDTSAYGLAARDRRALERRADELGVWRRFDVYPGADEVPCVLLARALAARPARVYVRYSSADGARAGMLYEDRPAGELVKAQLRAAGCTGVDTLAEADVVLAVNVPGERQAGGRPDFATVDTAARHLPEFVDFLERCLEDGRPVGVADVAYPNGAEDRFVRMVASRVRLGRLAAFGAWNTAGNTLGGVIATLALHAGSADRALRARLTFDRLVDDWLYQTIVRNDVRLALGNPSPFDLGADRERAEALIDERIAPLALELWKEHFAGEGLELAWRGARLAWPRLFTGVFDLEVTRS